MVSHGAPRPARSRASRLKTVTSMAQVLALKIHPLLARVLVARVEVLAGVVEVQNLTGLPPQWPATKFQIHGAPSLTASVACVCPPRHHFWGHLSDDAFLLSVEHAQLEFVPSHTGFGRGLLAPAPPAIAQPAAFERDHV